MTLVKYVQPVCCAKPYPAAGIFGDVVNGAAGRQGKSDKVVRRLSVEVDSEIRADP